ncbi:hypothetical protein Y032_0061g3289 [Ancylostoma ceylanicum]|uniref:Uncharacterized protein n=1 Tax=Ancylostoma ceylanicum TaxID=53326 RepID=A0A016U3Y5_9BILA|nr:hypothetical protein Y032_0061g3289 [Ancylostoma ceylanicum]
MGGRERFVAILDQQGLSQEAVAFVMMRKKVENSTRGKYFGIAHLCVVLLYRRAGVFLPEKELVAIAKELSLNITTLVSLEDILKLVCAGLTNTVLLAVSKDLYCETVPILAENNCNICIAGREGREIYDIAKLHQLKANFS